MDYKDVNLLRRFMSDRGKIRARRVTGNCSQHQRDVQIAIKTARELALLPYTQRTVNERGPGRRSGPSGPRRDGPGRTKWLVDTDELVIEDVDVEEDEGDEVEPDVDPCTRSSTGKVDA